jgi:hypothetical protein
MRRLRKMFVASLVAVGILLYPVSANAADTGDILWDMFNAGGAPKTGCLNSIVNHDGPNIRYGARASVYNGWYSCSSGYYTSGAYFGVGVKAIRNGAICGDTRYVYNPSPYQWLGTEALCAIAYGYTYYSQAYGKYYDAGTGWGYSGALESPHI